jgi:molybdopterin molybdotransferase
MDVDVPPFRRATMDGFAIGAADRRVGQALTVVGAVHAGQWPDTALVASQAQRVMTGAPVPEGTDAVVPFEWCTEQGERVTLDRVPEPDTSFVVERGAHVRQGDVVLRAGTRIDPGTLGVLATAGCGTVSVAA